MTELRGQVNPGAAALAVAFALTLVAVAPAALAQETPEEVIPASAPVDPVPPAEAPEAEHPASGEPVADASDAEQPSEGEPSAPATGEGEPGQATDGDAAPAEEPSAEAEEEEGEETSRFPMNHFGHRLQGGVSIVAGSGYQFEIAYGGEKCRTADGRQESVCHHRAPVFMDFLLSFGATEGLEVLLEFRLGLIEDINFNPDSGSAEEITSRPMAAGLGLRYLVSPMNRFKFFIGAILDVDFTSELPVDVYLRPIFGIQIEFVRWVGFFLQGSVNLSFVRYFGISLDGAGGFQFRFP